MCSKHRTQVLSEAKRRLLAGESCLLVSTQVVEAGVDIDFPLVFRAMAGLESLAQAAGRCNREGKNLNLGDFYIFTPPSEPPPGSLRYKKKIAQALIENNPKLDLFSPSTFPPYFESVYYTNGIGSLDAKNIQKERADQNFETVSAKFRMIPDMTETVFIPFDKEGIRLVNTLMEDGPTWGVLRELQPYGVSVFERAVEEMLEGGALRESEAVEQEVGEKQKANHRSYLALHNAPGPYYNCDFGLTTEADVTFLQIF